VIFLFNIGKGIGLFFFVPDFFVSIGFLLDMDNDFLALNSVFLCNNGVEGGARLDKVFWPGDVIVEETGNFLFLSCDAQFDELTSDSLCFRLDGVETQISSSDSDSICRAPTCTEQDCTMVGWELYFIS